MLNNWWKQSGNPQKKFIPVNVLDNISPLGADKGNIKGGFWLILKTTLIFKAAHEFNLNFKSTLKNGYCTFWWQPWFLENLNFSQVNNVHNVSLFSSEELFSWTIILNDSLKRFSCHTIGVLIVFCEDFQISMLYLPAQKSWCALIFSSVQRVSL